MSGFKSSLLLLAAFATLSCTGSVSEPKATAVYFVEREEGFEPNPTRIIVTPGFVRFDSGGGNKDFLLFDRSNKTIYNVSVQDELVLIIAPQTVTAPPPIKLEHRVERGDTDAPAVGGKKVARYRLLTNSDLCYDVYAADGLLPDALAALREYRTNLASEHAAVLAFTPADLQTPCDLANNIFAPARHLAHGFPVRVAETTGGSEGRVRLTELLNYETNFAADPALFQLPASYRRMDIKAFRGQK